VAYADPGVTLCLLVKRQFQDYIERNGHEPSVIFMQNHGLVVAADQLDDIDAIHEQVFGVLEDTYRDAGLDTRGPIVTTEEAGPSLSSASGDQSGQDLVALKCSGFNPAPAPLTPDHIVYSGVEPLDLDGTLSLEAYREQFDSDPRLLIHNGVLYSTGTTLTQARAACSLAADGAHVLRLTEAFGGVRFMSEEQWRFVVNWEAEAYRKSITESYRDTA
jgi:rhamnose utilization protein RhaD (predicted bifunctional aldolase and dehydrogenase)